jgi:hypothetical protein
MNSGARPMLRRVRSIHFSVPPLRASYRGSPPSDGIMPRMFRRHRESVDQTPLSIRGAIDLHPRLQTTDYALKGRHEF